VIRCYPVSRTQIARALGACQAGLGHVQDSEWPWQGRPGRRGGASRRAQPRPAAAAGSPRGRRSRPASSVTSAPTGSATRPAATAGRHQKQGGVDLDLAAGQDRVGGGRWPRTVGGELITRLGQSSAAEQAQACRHRPRSGSEAAGARSAPSRGGRTGCRPSVAQQITGRSGTGRPENSSRTTMSAS